MSRLNPRALAFWVAAAAIGYVCGGTRGAAIGLAISATLSFLL